MGQYFISYNSKDRSIVTAAAKELIALGLDVWLDERNIKRDENWIDELEKGLVNSRGYAVFWGPTGYGEYQEAELRLIKHRVNENEASCCVVTLPGTPQGPPQGFLTTVHHVRLKYQGDRGGIEEIYKGLTGQPPPKQPSRVAEPTSGAEDLLEQALATQAGALRRDLISFVVGTATDVPSVRCMWETREKLLRDLQLLSDDEAAVSPGLETVGTYFSMMRGDPMLEQEVDRFVDRLLSLGESPTLINLARFVARVRELKAGTRSAFNPPQVIVTTRLDLMTERALLAHGLSFQRIVHFRSADLFCHHSFRNVTIVNNDTIQLLPPGSDRPVLIGRSDHAQMNAIIRESRNLSRVRASGGAKNALEELPLDRDVDVVLYKFAGSIDHPQSCLLSSEQQVDFARKLLSFSWLPRAVTSVLRNGPVVFMGYSMLDADLRLLRKTLFDEDARNQDFSAVLVRPRPGVAGRPIFCQAENRLWDKLIHQSTAKLRLIDSEEESFLDLLRERAERELQHSG